MSGSERVGAESISQRQEFGPAEGRKGPVGSQQVRRKRGLFPRLSRSCFKMLFSFLFYLFVALLCRNKSGGICPCYIFNTYCPFLGKV